MAAYDISFGSKSFFTPHFLINLLISEDDSLICCQQAKKIILLCGQVYFSPISEYLSAVWANFQSGQF